MVSTQFPVPERIPGTLIQDAEHLHNLKEVLAWLCNTQTYK